MFTHTFLGTNDIDQSRTFYTAVMGALGHATAVPLPHGTAFPSANGALVVAKPANGEQHTVSNGHTLGFKATDSSVVDAFHAAGLANGGTCEGEPGVRVNSPGQQYGAYLRDPDGNKICAFAPNPGA
ncbi:MAG: glyoxalase [Novosphingobium sp. 17-62-19]|uniref:VOC family protein n=1 Tax=Novosphingobium sp. 17-62-19 TaxID=1970406 RepID=UPI000BDB5801|nr:VOC family protein [Novosphingobium sp. 17-62-19]OYX93614.1 MAG: glyoxalase [Novosphingobium sp. 35-62-5]OZA21730.1 MAG: glyoxalase [Novosphingobium sp. 17-62-19]OZA54868.1 MAG: glyoxalase [Sphingomonadales bacterium 39-62-4]HQS98378.1 VOC family protein [Novosphingobium sp.]